MAVSWPPWAWHTTAAPRELGRARSARRVGGRPRRSATLGGATTAATWDGDEAGAATETETARWEAIAADGDGSEEGGGEGNRCGREGGWEGVGVEVKVSTQPQTPAAGKVHRSTLVINKFVGSTPLSVDQPRCHADTTEPDAESSDDELAAYSPRSTLRRVPSSTTSLAAAVAVASTGSDVHPAPEDDDECGGMHLSAAAAAEPKQLLLFTSRRGDKQDLLQSVRRCRQLRQKPLFILEPYCIATS